MLMRSIIDSIAGPPPGPPPADFKDYEVVEQDEPRKTVRFADEGEEEDEEGEESEGSESSSESGDESEGEGEEEQDDTTARKVPFYTTLTLLLKFSQSYM